MKRLLTSTLIILFASGLSVLSAADLHLLSGEKSSVEIKSISPESVKVLREGEPAEVSLSELISISFPEPESVAAEPFQLTLRDGSRLSAATLEMNPRTLKIESELYQRASLPTSSVGSLLFQPLDDVVAGSWRDLLTKEYAADVVIIRKGDLLDRIRAVVGEIKEGKLQLLLDKREVEVPLEKLFGVIFATRKEEIPDGLCSATFVNKRSVGLKSLKLSGDTWKGDLVQGGSLVFQTSHLTKLDFSHGKIVYLSDLEPADLKYKPFWGDFTWTYQRDVNVDGDPLRIGKEEFDKGLWIHSRTELEYRLARKYSRFQATVGIDEAIAAEIRSKGVGKVKLTILADDESKFEEIISPVDKPREIDIDLSDTLTLKIIVDYADDLDISDHLVLGNARILK
ncbi:NPCBM/NEW2 domain protein [Polystyrenella longa]|uniref:NPCBM/NEW2 domain protein n=1 Tax=Polystyrenella longa TaxID=2528007 RepID=A0A518CKF3_9PLAN|nr:NPCBM/NEW2 domain-containing protein [Polystyrenella longa]QDU79701.1 NPCBM/NEW2 domain protein [Polystyrenella longa]